MVIKLIQNTEDLKRVFLWLNRNRAFDTDWLMEAVIKYLDIGDEARKREFSELCRFKRSTEELDALEYCKKRQEIVARAEALIETVPLPVVLALDVDVSFGYKQCKVGFWTVSEIGMEGEKGFRQLKSEVRNNVKEFPDFGID